MNLSQSELLNAALALPDVERLALAEALLSSLPDGLAELDDLDDEAFEQELLRRGEEMKKDPSIGIPWSELKKLR